MPGTYNESVTVDFDDIELVGLVEKGERPVFDGKGTMNDAVLVSGNNFAISGFEIRNYKGNGVVVNKARNATFSNLVCQNTGKYGVYPVLCDGVLVENCVVSDVWDAGVYAGQCNNVVIQNCESYRNTIGIETENCVGVLMANNSAHGNSLGLLVVLLPDLPTTVASDARVINNRVLGNNYPNLSPPGNTVNLVEPGNGIAINAADHTEVTKNEVRGNDSYGIAMYALTDVFPPDHKLNVEPNPDGNYIHDNMLSENGSHVSKRLKARAPPVAICSGAARETATSGASGPTSGSRPTCRRKPWPAPPAAVAECVPSGVESPITTIRDGRCVRVASGLVGRHATNVVASP